MKLIVCLLLILYFTGSNGIIQRHCNNRNTSCFVCGCENQSLFNIHCNDNRVIQMEPGGYLMRESVSKSKCSLINYGNCTKARPSTISSLQNRIEVYKNCTFRNSCQVKLKGSIKKRDNRLVNYPFSCHHKTSIIQLESKQEAVKNNPIFYFSGEKHVGQKIDCECTFISSAPIRLEIYFIHLKPSTCSKVKFLSQNVQLFGCFVNDTTLLHIRYIYINTEFKLEIRGMEPDQEDVLFFRLWGNNLSVNCSGCRNSTDDVSSTPPAKITSTTASELSTTVTDTHIYAAIADQTNNDPIFGGILAVIIIINIVGIGIYCFLRRQSKQQNKPDVVDNASRKGDQSQYNYIDVTDTTASSGLRKNSNANSVDIKKPNSNYHVLEVEDYSAPVHARADDEAKQKIGKERAKKDDYDHINDETKSSISKTIKDAIYNHLDNKMAVSRDATPHDDYSHIGNLKGLLKGKLIPVDCEPRNLQKNPEMASYVNVDLEAEKVSSGYEVANTEDADTYNHLQK